MRIHGAGSPYPIEEFAPDLKSFDTNAPNCDTSLAVATMNTGAFFSCIRLKKEANAGLRYGLC